MVDKLLTPSQASAYLGLDCVATLNRWREKSQGPIYCKIADQVIRYRLSDLETFVASRAMPPTALTAPNWRRVRFKGLTDAQWDLVRETFLKTDKGRRCLTRSFTEPREFVNRVLNCVINGGWPAETGATAVEQRANRQLTRKAQTWNGWGAWELLFRALSKDPDFPFDLVHVDVIVGRRSTSSGCFYRMLPLTTTQYRDDWAHGVRSRLTRVLCDGIGNTSPEKATP